MDIVLFDQAEMKIILSNHGNFKPFDINQSESSNTYREVFIFFDINQSESSFYSKWSFQKLDINHSDELLTDCKICFRSEQNYVHKTSHLIFFIEFFQDN